jgi:hypothetical protein
MWGAAALSTFPSVSATAGGGLPARKSSAKPALNVNTETRDVIHYNLHAIRCTWSDELRSPKTAGFAALRVVDYPRHIGDALVRAFATKRREM